MWLIGPEGFFEVVEIFSMRSNSNFCCNRYVELHLSARNYTEQFQLPIVNDAGNTMRSKTRYRKVFLHLQGNRLRHWVCTVNNTADSQILLQMKEGVMGVHYISTTQRISRLPIVNNTVKEVSKNCENIRLSEIEFKKTTDTKPGHEEILKKKYMFLKNLVWAVPLNCCLI
jgi:hypothetical protein